MEEQTNKGVETKDPVAPTEPAVEAPKTEEPKVEEAVDYKAELEAAKAQSEKLLQERNNYRRAALIAKGKRTDDGSVVITDRKELERMVDERVAAKAVELARSAPSSLDSVLGELSDNPDEQALIKHIYDTRISHTGTDVAALRNDLEEAQLLANKKTVKKTISELRAAAVRRPTPGSGSGASTTPTGQVGDKDFTPEQMAYFTKRGLDPEKVRSNLNRVPGIGK